MTTILTDLHRTRMIDSSWLTPDTQIAELVSDAWRTLLACASIPGHDRDRKGPVSADNGSYRLPLAFSRRDCDRCGGTRLYGLVCPECGFKPRPGEADIGVQRRQRIVARVRERPAVQADSAEPQDFVRLVHRAGQIVKPFMESLAGLAQRGEDTTSLIGAADDVDRLHAEVSVRQPRPWAAPGRQVAVAVSDLREALDLFLGAFGARDLGEAQSIGAAAQRRLDDAAQSAGQLASQVDLLLRLIDAEASDFVGLATHMLFDEHDPDAVQPRDVVATDALGEPRARRIIGPDEPIVAGVGLAILWVSAIAEVLFDRDRFYLLAHSAYELFRSSPALPKLGEDPTWRANEIQAQLAAVNDGHTLDTLLSAARHDLDQVRAVLLYVQDLFEGPAKHVVATLLACTTGKDYRRLVNENAGSLLQRAHQGAHNDLVAGLSDLMRNASAHRQFAVDGDIIVLRPGQHETRLNAPWFWDQAIASAETVAALSTGLMVAMAQRDLSQPTDLDGLGLTPPARVSIMMSSSGYRDISTELSATSAIIEASGALTNPMALVGALLPALPAETTDLTLRVREPERIRTFAVDLRLLRTFTELDPERQERARTLLFWEACAGARLDGEPLISVDALRHMIALEVGKQVNGLPADANRRLREMRGLAERVGDDHCASVLRRATTALRLNALGLSAERVVADAIDELAEWEKTPQRTTFGA